MRRQGHLTHLPWRKKWRAGVAAAPGRAEFGLARSAAASARTGRHLPFKTYLKARRCEGERGAECRECGGLAAGLVESPAGESPAGESPVGWRPARRRPLDRRRPPPPPRRRLVASRRISLCSCNWNKFLLSAAGQPDLDQLGNGPRPK